MRYQYLNSIHPVIERHLQYFIKPNATVIDATLGNGHDLLKIADYLSKEGTIYGFDIQLAAIQKSEALLSTAQNIAPKVRLIHDSHTNFKQHISEPVDFIIYNLGYLPGGDKAITTIAESTLKSIQAGLELLTANGIMLIAVYHGHEAGKAEKTAIEDYLQSLDQKYFHVLQEAFVNQRNNPPFIYLIEKAKIG